MTPVPNDPTLPEFFIYRLEAKGMPFYVGIGRGGRAADRIKYTKRLMRREARGDAAKWALNTRVIAGLLGAGIEPDLVYLVLGLTRAAALAAEVPEIHRLVAEGYVLANVVHNRNGERDARTIVDVLLGAIADRVKEPR